ncbi:M15 family metallopeptidase [Polaribacter porphyrae]|uniref:D-alanyl-D-alanine carboxypeptidase-like core domain-containing protein n=1 Tax=Polaribacter porphyrae TaxID=1137780 RepID=A0A2S7WTD8_9FLAO|nr:M15 family metallopeptidase [Polaribacter porphyrae]PQJ80834.1 hypothetical protein BTO18_17375 [Polaribacter porphyrae]
MGIYKILKTAILSLFFIVTVFSCKPKKAQNENLLLSKKNQLKKAFRYPNYLNKNYILGKFDYMNSNNFVIVPKDLSNKKIYIRKEVLVAFLKMQTAAKEDGISFKIISGTRSFAHQKRIWDYKWNSKYKDLPPLERVQKILLFSAMPTTSRHHWGTDIDLNNLTNSYFTKGKGLNEYNWLLKNASKFGFYQPYASKKEGRTGYEEEKWHWSYKPLSQLYLKYYNEHISIEDITGFDGSKYSKNLQIINKYVHGINSELK